MSLMFVSACRLSSPFTRSKHSLLQLQSGPVSLAGIGLPLLSVVGSPLANAFLWAVVFQLRKKQ